MEQSDSSCCPWWCKCGYCSTLCLILCNACCCCCKRITKEKSSKYPHIFYGQLVQQQERHTDQIPGQNPSSESIVKRGYKYPQKYREYAIHPQLGGESKDEPVVTEQPHEARQSPGAKQTARYFVVAEDIDGSSIVAEDIDGASYHSTTSNGSISYGSMEDVDSDMDVGFVDRGQRPSLSVIERSPEATLNRGEHLQFPSSRPRQVVKIRPLDPSLLKKLEELQPAASPEISGVQFSLYFDEIKAMFFVHVKKVTNLPSQRPALTSNPYVQIYLLPAKSEVLHSQSIDGTHNPTFDQVFRFTNLSVDNLRRQMMVMRFYVNVNHFVGGLLYNLENADLAGNKIVEHISEFDEEEGLKESCQGDILLTLCYQSKTGVLEVLVLEVTNLKKQDILRMPNPYVKINLLYRSQRLSKWKTTVKKSTTNPIFHEVCEIDVSSLNIEEVEVNVVVMNHDRLGHNNVMGSVSFGNTITHQSGQSHWNKIMINTNTDVSRWHPLITLSASRSNSPSPSPRKGRSKSPMPSVHGCFKMTPTGMQL